MLVKQLAHELKNYNLYMTLVNYFSVKGIEDLAEYYRKRADEELLHHKWCMEYLTDADITFTYPAVEINTEKFEGFEKPFEITVEREIETTNMIYAIRGAAFEEKDFMTVQWLDEYLIKEQIEEEDVSRMAWTIISEDTVPIFDRAKEILELLKK